MQRPTTGTKGEMKLAAANGSVERTRRRSIWRKLGEQFPHQIQKGYNRIM